MKASLIREAWSMFRSYCGLDGFAITHSRQRARVCRWGALAHSYSGEIVRWYEMHDGSVYKTVQGRPRSFSRARKSVRSVSHTRMNSKSHSQEWTGCNQTGRRVVD
jgi:hypothetical protein